MTNKDSFVLLNSSKENSDKLKLKFLIELVLAIENEDFKTAESLLKKVSFYKLLTILINYNDQKVNTTLKLLQDITKNKALTIFFILAYNIFYCF